MEALLKAVLGSGSMEGTYLGVIALLDQAESLANSGVTPGYVSSESALMIGEVKQNFIVRFAEANLTHTLQAMREAVAMEKTT